MKWWQWLVVIFTEVWPAVILVLLIGAAACCHGDEYQGWLGHWETVVATAYTPSDPIDDAYHDSKGARWRWITADGVTDVRRKPYGVAVPLRHGEPWWRFGTRVIIPTGLGYLDRSRADEREFVVDDVGNGAAYFPSEAGHVHIDLRWVDRRDALRWAGPEGKRVIRVFVCVRRVPPPAETIVPIPDTIAAVHDTTPAVHDTIAWPAAPPEPVVLNEPAETEAAMPMTDLLLIAVVALGLRKRFRRRASWEPGR